MNLPFLSVENAQAFVLVLLRVSAIITTIPVFSERSVPTQVKAGLSIILAVVIFPVVVSRFPAVSTMPLLQLIFGMIGEVMIGIIIGFGARLVFAGIQMAGNIIGFQMGFAIVNIIDPMTSAQVSIIAELKYLIAMLIFLSINAHHFFFLAITQSYDWVAPFGFHFSGSLMQYIFELSRDLFVIALKIGAPLMAVMLFTNVGLGVVARTVPQMNIFIVGFPLQISIGLIFLGLTAPLFTRIVQGLMNSFESKIATLLRLMS